MTARTPQRQRLLEVLRPAITAQGYDLEDVSVSAAGRRSVVRVVVDGDGGIDLDAVADVSRSVAEVLDAPALAAVLTGPYVLEVSSPGVDRPLTELRHWRRAAGRLVRVAAAGHEVTGRVADVVGDEPQPGGATRPGRITLIVDGRPIEVPIAELGPGRVQVEFAHGNSEGLADEED